MSTHIGSIKQRFYFTPDQLEIFAELLEPIVMSPPKKDNHKDYVLLSVTLNGFLDKVYSGDKRPERIPVSDSMRQRARPINAANMGLDVDNTKLDIMDRKLEVVGYESYDDALKAGGFNNNDEVMAQILGITVQEYRDKTAQEAAIEQYRNEGDVDIKGDSSDQS